MANIQVKKTVANKNDFDKVVDNAFTTFVDPALQEDTDTVEELFRLYDKLFYDIPVEGETNSHRYLVKESSKLVEFEKDTEDIQPLLDEISQLREQLLLVNQQLIEVQTQAITDAAN